jgi:hypothetical protein
MRYLSEMTCDGPYLRVLLPDVLPPDWGTLRRDLELELDEGGMRVTLVVGECSPVAEDDPSLAALVGSLRNEDVDAFVVRQTTT